MEQLIFNLPGDWTHPYLLFRLLEVVGSPWQGTEDGFIDLETDDRVTLAVGRRVEHLAEAFASATDPSRTPLSDAMLEALDAHQLVFQVQGDRGDDELLGLRATLRATNAVVDGGATAVQCVQSHLVHEADAFQALMKDVEAAGNDREALKQAMYRVVVRYLVNIRASRKAFFRKVKLIKSRANYPFTCRRVLRSVPDGGFNIGNGTDG